MATIDQLMEGKKPGEIKICTSKHPMRDGYFVPYYNIRGLWYGIFHALDNRIDNEIHNSEDEGDYWQLYTQPKKKVKRWLWVYANNKKVLNNLMTFEEATNRVPDGIQKLLWSETEFEE